MPPQPLSKPLCLVSACLLGLCTRYDGKNKTNKACLHVLKHYQYIPICPEQLGGLPTPRPPAMLMGGDGHAVLDGRARVLDPYGRDLSPAFIQGANMVRAIARMQNIHLALLKSGSPSCGCTPRPGVCAALLQRSGIQVQEF